MPNEGLTGHVTTLIYMSSFTLAVSQYYYNSLKTKFDDAYKRLDSQPRIGDRNNPSLETLRTTRDILKKDQNIQDISIISLGLFACLCIISVVKTIEITFLTLEKQPHFVLHCIVLTTSISISALIIFCGIRLFQIKNFVRKYNARVDQFISDLKLVSGAVGIH